MIKNGFRFTKPARVMAAGFFAGTLLVYAWNAAPAPVLSWVNDHADTNRWFVEVTGLPTSTLNQLRESKWTPAQWQRLLTVHAEQGDLIGDIGLPAMIGNYSAEKTVVRFNPSFPLEPGLKYRASFYSDKLPGDKNQGRFVTAVLQVPARSTVPTTVVKQIYPSASALPENLLKFYVHFSAPMSRGHIYEHIHLRDEAGKDVQLPFLEIDEELWDPSMTRLTLFIDPGRIKRGVTPLEEIGPALQHGKSFVLHISQEWRDAAGAPLRAAFQKEFRVGPNERDPIDPAKWRIEPPQANTREPLAVNFPKPIDHALAHRVIRIMDGANQIVSGQIALADEERRWTFVPAHPWLKARYTLSVQKTIEDLAGNNIGKAFEVDLFEGVERRFTNATVKLPFEVR